MISIEALKTICRVEDLNYINSAIIEDFQQTEETARLIKKLLERFDLWNSFQFLSS